MINDTSVLTAQTQIADAEASACILDFDGSVTRQSRVMSMLGSSSETVDFTELGPSLRYLASKKSVAEFENCLSKIKRHWLTFTGSGDFHHITASLLNRFSQPLSVVIFDYHPDWMATSPWPCCGSWVLDLLKMPNIEKIISIGLGSHDIGGWWINYGAVKDILSGKVEFYPYNCKISRCFGMHNYALDCAYFKKKLGYSEIHWNTIETNDWDALIKHILDGLPATDLYLSIDKDCLNTDAAVTNWEIGYLTLDQLISAIGKIMASKNVIGVDVTGEYSEIKIKNRLFNMISKSDRPKLPAHDKKDLLRNEETNIAILNALGFKAE